MEIKTAGLQEIGIFLDWAAAEGWNPGLDDAQPFFSADHGGFFIGRVDGEPVAVVSVVCSGDAHAFLGFYMCHASFRGRGYGIQLWRHGLARAGARVVGLDGVVAQQENYKKSGFSLAWNNVRYGGLIAPGVLPSGGVRVAVASDLSAIVAYDAPRYGASRVAFLTSWLQSNDVRRSFVATGDGDVRGYCTARRCRSGFKIGPLFAPDRATAETLLGAAVDYAGGGEIFLDTPQTNAAAVKLAESLGMTPRFETARMYRGTAPALPIGEIFGVTTFELG
jgi:ribosomal protein S18 acetylase RimI-like enzyme